MKKRKFNIKYFKKGIDNGKICIIIVVWGITTMYNFEYLEKLGFSSNEAKVYGTLIKHKVLNGYEIAKLSGVARSLVYEVINRLVAKGAVVRLDGEPNFYKPVEYVELIRAIKEENERNIACAEREPKPRNLSTARRRKFRFRYGANLSKLCAAISKTQSSAESKCTFLHLKAFPLSAQPCIRTTLAT